MTHLKDEFIPGGLGLSAETLRRFRDGAAATGGVFHPVDVDDLCRCVDVSPHPPQYMRGASPEWTALVQNWTELASLLGTERASGAAPRTGRRLREVLQSARLPSTVGSR